jgi:hypothetical protein
MSLPRRIASMAIILIKGSRNHYLRTQVLSLVNKQFNLLTTVQNLNVKIVR